MKTKYIIAAVLLCVFALLLKTQSFPAPAKPDTSLARPLGRWPDAADLQRLKSVQGKSAAGVINTLGHPSRVEANGERWVYPWLATAVVYFKNGIVTDTFYTAGY